MVDSTWVQYYLNNTIEPINDFHGISLATAGDTYQFMLRALKNDVVSFYDLLRFTSGKSIANTGEIISLSGYSATEGYHSFSADVVVKSPAGITVIVYGYDSNKQKTYSTSILQNKTVIIAGAIALYNRAILDAPEIMTFK